MFGDIGLYLIFYSLIYLIIRIIVNNNSISTMEPETEKKYVLEDIMKKRKKDQ